MDNEQVEFRKAKLENLAKTVKAYPERYEKTHELKDIINLEDGVTGVKVAGRICYFTEYTCIYEGISNRCKIRSF